MFSAGLHLQRLTRLLCPGQIRGSGLNNGSGEKGVEQSARGGQETRVSELMGAV